jgi:putative ABC transport system substrate-binding protein
MGNRWVRSGARLAVALAVGTAVPSLVQAQGPTGAPRIGYLDGSDMPRRFEALQRGLSDLGYVENRTIVIERRSAAGQPGRLPELAADLVRLQPRVIVASGSRPSLALKNATPTIPIVMAFATDPVGLGLVASLARPGGNVTGSSNLGAGLMGKRLQLLAEIVPSLSRVGVIWSPSVKENELDYPELQAASVALGMALESFAVAQPAEYDGAFKNASERAKVVAVLSGPMASANRAVIVAAAARHKVPAIYYDAAYAETGGLMSYGPSLTALHRRAAVFVDKILKGAKPADLPVEQPTKFELVVNLKAAKALGIAIPQSILVRADEVIE